MDKFVSSPQFGERMAVHWLDLVRYADTMGFHGDVPITMYPYRDYVIRSFNENKPFDQFTREQLGGDLLPNPTTWQRVASGYNRLNRMTNEAARNPASTWRDTSPTGCGRLRAFGSVQRWDARNATITSLTPF